MVTRSTLPLAGVRVLDLSRLLPGPYTTWVLASMGAEVVKVEDTAAGDYARNMPPLLGEVSALFHVLNRGKRSIALDLKSEQGQALLLRMAAKVDVVVEQFRPGVMERLGVGYERLRQVREDIVLCSMTGYGQTGPMAALAGHDINFQALAGTLWMDGEAGGPPSVSGIPSGDLFGAMAAVSRIMAALYRRERSSTGEWIDLAITDVVASVAAPLFAAYSQQGEAAPGRGEGVLNGGLAQYGTYRTRDGRYLAVGALEPKFLQRFAELAGRPEWAQALPLPGPHQDSLRAEIAEVIATRSRDEWEQLLEGVDCCVSPVLEPSEAAAHPQFRARGRAAGAPAELGPARWVETPMGELVEGNAPAQGEHSAELLLELGLEAQEIAQLRACGVIR